MNLNRTEELEIKRDIGRIRKALEDISDKVVPVSKNTQVVVKDGDPFFGKIHMSEKHLDALREAYSYDLTLSEVGLIEECSELIQALSKRIRDVNQNKDNIVEEMTHVIICTRLICLYLGITPEEIQQEIYKKYPDGYDLTTYMADNIPYYVERTKGSE